MADYILSRGHYFYTNGQWVKFEDLWVYSTGMVERHAQGWFIFRQKYKDDIGLGPYPSPQVAVKRFNKFYGANEPLPETRAAEVGYSVESFAPPIRGYQLDGLVFWRRHDGEPIVQDTGERPNWASDEVYEL